tara:strand:- start:68 stop:445 length:378 start_codon:yes stop_codon:yes gene_type:complete
MKKLLVILVCLFVSFEVKSKLFTTQELLNLYEKPVNKGVVEWYVTGVYQSLFHLNNMNLVNEDGKLCVPENIGRSLTVDTLLSMTKNRISKDNQNKQKLLNYPFPLTLILVLSDNFPCDDNWKTR